MLHYVTLGGDRIIFLLAPGLVVFIALWHKPLSPFPFPKLGQTWPAAFTRSVKKYLKQREQHGSLQKVSHSLCGEAATRRGVCQAHGWAEGHSWNDQIAWSVFRGIKAGFYYFKL